MPICRLDTAISDGVSYERATVCDWRASFAYWQLA
jgi:hypothetical protein